MRTVRQSLVAVWCLAVAALACGAPAVASSLTSAPLPTASLTPWPATNESGVRYCLYDPAAPASPLVLRPPAGTPTPFPTSTPPVAGTENADAAARQLGIFRGVWNAVNEHYVDPGFNGRNWAAIGDRYEALVGSGFDDEAFYALMQAMIGELGDEHSYFQSPAEVEEEAAALAGQQDFVGIGTLLLPTADGAATIISVFPDSPASDAGLRLHDVVLAVDGGPLRDKFGISLTRGPAGTPVTLTVRTPGGTPREVTVTRREVTGGIPVAACIVPGTRFGYVILPTFLDETIDGRLREALTALTADGPLDGLILDNRMNGGGLGSVAEATLGMFLDGTQGAFVTRTTREDLVIEPEDVGGSQMVPLVVLVSPDTVSYGEIVSGILHQSGRATLVGQVTLGNVEQLRRYELDDGSLAWIASATFEPIGLSAGIWEDAGIVPDVVVEGKWDEFTEANDPGIAAAVEILLAR